MRQWVRTRVSQFPVLASLPIDFPNETTSHGQDETYLRYSLQTGDAAVVGVGTEIKRRRRVGRVYIEVFGAVGAGEGLVSQLSTQLEEILRVGSDSRTRVHDDITLFEPSTFERPEGGRYCQVVNARVQVDLFS